MNWSPLLEYYRNNRGSVNGALIGLCFALFVIFIGFFKTLFIALCVFLGYYIGKMLSVDRDYLRKLLDRILPPGIYK